MENPELLSPQAGRSAASLIYEMSRLYYLSRAIHVAATLSGAAVFGLATQVSDRHSEVTIVQIGQ